MACDQRLSYDPLVVKSSTQATGTTAMKTTTAEGGNDQSSAGVMPEGDDEYEVITDTEEEIDETAMNYDFAMKEVILNELNSGELLSLG